ncbi:MAG: PadR family transcriptional regulator [Methanobrevibacter sp.]|jgi:DNA-binding PadR family transcriptional regulator|nr:PadR family transcriptional regulator [Methanobrevibacter sp.]
MSLKHGLLGLLEYGSMTGYELNKTFKDSLNHFWQVQASQIYRELNSMKKLGWLSSEIVLQVEKPNKKLYTITEKGREEVERWLKEDNLENELAIKSGFLMKIFFAGKNITKDNINVFETFKNQCQISLDALSSTGENIENYNKLVKNYNENKLYWELTAHFGREYFKMCIKWADESIKLIEKRTVKKNKFKK